MLHRLLNGADLHAPTNYLVENDTGSTITKLKVVTFDGIGTAFPSIKVAIGSLDLYRGIVMDDILDGNSGYITSLGFLIGIDTSAWAEGTSLYCDAFGDLSITPSGPLVATVYKQDILNGQIFVEGSNSTGGGGGSGNVVGPPSSTDNAITRWDGLTGKLIQDSKAKLQDGGAIETQAILTNRLIVETVTVPTNFTMLASNIEIEDGEIIIESDAEVVII